MPPLTDLTGLLVIASVIAALASHLPRVKSLAGHQLWIFIAAVFVVMLVPLGDMPLASYVRGITGDLSITSAVLAWLTLAHSHRTANDEKHRTHLLILIAAVAVIFYPMTLGMSLMDPYRLGYSDATFIAAVLLIATLAWLKQSGLIAACLALAVIAWSLGMYESTNLWDYLLDPLVAIYALAALLRKGLRKS